jgi:hypothetical protein
VHRARQNAARYISDFDTVLQKDARRVLGALGRTANDVNLAVVVHFDGLFGNPQIEGRLLVQHAGCHQPEHLALPWGEGIALGKFIAS